MTKFRLTTSASLYREYDEQIGKLKELGFEFEQYIPDFGRLPGLMVFAPSGIAEYKIIGEPTIEIQTMEDLMKFKEKFGELILRDGDLLEIYNDYTE